MYDLKKKIDPSKYGIIEVNPENAPKELTREEIQNGESGIVYVPWVFCEHTDESLNDYKKFMKQYHKEHELCPKCGFTEHITTIFSYPLYDDNRSAYKDQNKCICVRCGDHHIVHDRVSKEAFKGVNKI